MFDHISQKYLVIHSKKAGYYVIFSELYSWQLHFCDFLKFFEISVSDFHSLLSSQWVGSERASGMYKHQVQLSLRLFWEIPCETLSLLRLLEIDVTHFFFFQNHYNALITAQCLRDHTGIHSHCLQYFINSRQN